MVVTQVVIAGAQVTPLPMHMYYVSEVSTYQDVCMSVCVCVVTFLDQVSICFIKDSCPNFEPANLHN